MQDSELFAELTEAELSKLAPLCSEFVAVEGGVIFTEGRNASNLYLVAEGQVALQKAIRVPHATRSRRTTIVVCHPGDVVGWSAIVEPYKYTLSAVGWESSRLVSIEARMLRRAFDMYPEMAYKVMRSLSSVISRRLKQTADTLISERKLSFAGLKL